MRGYFSVYANEFCCRGAVMRLDGGAEHRHTEQRRRINARAPRRFRLADARSREHPARQKWNDDPDWLPAPRCLEPLRGSESSLPDRDAESAERPRSTV